MRKQKEKTSAWNEIHVTIDLKGKYDTTGGWEKWTKIAIGTLAIFAALMKVLS